MAGLLGVFELNSLGAERFEGPPAGEGGTHVYGGHTFAQALLSAQTVEGPGRVSYAAHAQFLRVGLPSLPIEYHVEQLANGRSFSSYRIVARQQGKPILAMSAAFQAPFEGLEYQATPAPLAPPADAFEPESDRFARMVAALPQAGGPIQLLPSGVDGRWTDPQDLRAPLVKSATRMVWLRATDFVGDDPRRQQVALAYCSDFSFIETALRPFGISWHHPANMFATSLEHSIWFHRPSGANDWHLCTSHCPSAHGGRAFIRGELHDGRGRLIASIAQEGLIRAG